MLATNRSTRYRRSMTDPFIHPTAIVDDGAEIGADAKIWHFCHVMANAKIGRAVILGQNVFVAPNVAVGAGSRVQNNVSLYDGVRLEDDVFVGPSAVFTNVRRPRAHVSRKDEFESTIVRRGATIGAGAVLRCGIEVGRHAMVGAGAVVTKAVADHALVFGNPARLIGWVCRCGERLAAEPSRETFTCPCGDRYRETSTYRLERLP